MSEPTELDATIAASVAEALAATLPTLITQIVSQVGRVARETPVEETEPAPDPDRESVIAAEAEKARWDAMPAEELAAEESAARIQRWRDAHADITDRKVDGTAILASLERGMTSAEIAAAKR